MLSRLQPSAATHRSGGSGADGELCRPPCFCTAKRGRPGPQAPSFSGRRTSPAVVRRGPPTLRGARYTALSCAPVRTVPPVSLTSGEVLLPTAHRAQQRSFRSPAPAALRCSAGSPSRSQPTAPSPQRTQQPPATPKLRINNLVPDENRARGRSFPGSLRGTRRPIHKARACASGASCGKAPPQPAATAYHPCQLVSLTSREVLLATAHRA